MDNRDQSSNVIDNDHRQENVNIPKDKRIATQNGKVIRTRSGQIVKNWTDFCTHNSKYQCSWHVSHSTVCHMPNHVILGK